DSQEVYDYFFEAVSISERWHIPVLFRVTTRVCHSKTVVWARARGLDAPPTGFERDVASRVMIPAYARPAHRRLRTKLAELAEWNERSTLNRVRAGTDTVLG